MNLRGIRIWGAGLIGAGLALGGLGSVAAAKEKWVRVDAPYFTVYAETGSEREAREWAVDFEQFRRAMEQVIRVSPERLPPAVAVLFRDDKAYQPFRPTKDGKIQEVAGTSMELPMQWVMATRFGDSNEQTRGSIYYGGTQWFLGGFSARKPDWFRAGFGELFRTFEIRGDEFTIGTASVNNVRSLQQMTLVPMDQIFGVESRSLDFRDDERTRRFYAQSWLFVHYALLGRESRKDTKGRASQLDELMAELAKGRTEREVLPAVFGVSAAEMTKVLERYLSGGRYVTYRGKFAREAVAAGMKIQVIGETEIALAKGRACLTTRDVVGARGHFSRARLMEENNPLVHEALGDLALVDNDRGVALERYARATELGSKNSHAWFFLGDDFVRNASGGAGAGTLPIFDADKARLAANRFERAINLRPGFVTSYERLALLMPSLKQQGPTDKEFLDLGRRVAPGNPLIEAGLGVWEIRAGQTEPGRARLREILERPRRAGDGLARQIAQREVKTAALGGEETEVRRLLGEGKAAEAGARLDKLISNPLAADRRAELLIFRREIVKAELLDRVELLVGEGNGNGAALLLADLLEGELTPELRTRAEALLVRAKTGKK